MKKIVFSLLAAVAFSGQLAAQIMPSAQITEGQNYFVIEQPPAAPPGSGVLVTEVFSYLCNHCNTFEPYVQSWKKNLPEGVEFNRIPVEFGRAIWGLYARGYVTAAVLGIADEAHVPMMDNIWKNRKQLRTMDELAGFYSTFGVDEGSFTATSKSFAVDMRVKKEQQMVREFGVTGTPSIIVNNKYRVSAGGANSSFEKLLATVDYLIDMELAAQAAQTAAVEAPAAAVEAAVSTTVD